MPQGASTRQKEPDLLASFYITKMDALRRLCVHIGLMPPYVPAGPTEEELRCRREQWGWIVPLAVAQLLSDDATPIEKTASGVLLDIIVPGWRDRCPELVGVITERGDYRVQLWRAAVFERDGHRCIKCGATDQLHAHHRARWVDAPFLRVVVENGVTLCGDCHRDEHAKQT
ncbi:hypothetical protein [Ralstonia phage p2110]|nr:hypothetical protein [Ralstonia phage p2110]